MLDQLHHVLADALLHSMPVHPMYCKGKLEALAAYNAAKAAPQWEYTHHTVERMAKELDRAEVEKAAKAAPAELNMTPGPLEYKCNECERLKAECAKLREELKEIHSVTVPRETYEDETRDKMKWKEECAKLLDQCLEGIDIVMLGVKTVENLRDIANAKNIACERAEARLEALTSDAAVEAAIVARIAFFPTLSQDERRLSMKEAIAAARQKVMEI